MKKTTKIGRICDIITRFLDPIKKYASKQLKFIYPITVGIIREEEFRRVWENSADLAVSFQFFPKFVELDPS